MRHFQGTGQRGWQADRRGRNGEDGAVAEDDEGFCVFVRSLEEGEGWSFGIAAGG